MKRVNEWLWVGGLASALVSVAPASLALAQPPTGEPEGVGEAIPLDAGFGMSLEEGALGEPFALGDGGQPGGPMGEHGGPGVGRRGPGGFFGGPGRMGMGGRIAGLDLTESQRRRIADIRDRQLRQGVQARAELQLARLDLRQLLREESPDRGAIEEQIDRIGSMHANLEKAHVSALLEMRSVLTEEQWRKLREGRSELRRDARSR